MSPSVKTSMNIVPTVIVFAMDGVSARNVALRNVVICDGVSRKKTKIPLMTVVTT